MTRHQASGPAVVMSITATFLAAVFAVVVWVGRFVLWPIARWWWRVLRREWIDLGRRRALAKGRRQFRLSRRQRRHLINAHYTNDPELVMRSLWWCVWMLAQEVPATRIAERMQTTDQQWADAVGFVTAQAYTIPTRHPEEIEAATWAMELRALHQTDRPLPAIDT